MKTTDTKERILAIAFAHWFKRILPVAVSLTLVASKMTAVAAPTIVNGSFEADVFSASGYGYSIGLGGVNPLTGWTTLNIGEYPWGLQNQNAFGAGPTPFGNQWVVVGYYGMGGSWIQQVVSGFTVGQTNTLSFALSSEDEAATLAQVSFPSGSSTPAQTFVGPPAFLWDTWRIFSMNFVATSTTVTIRFTGLAGLYGDDPGIDNVIIRSNGCAPPYLYGAAVSSSTFSFSILGIASSHWNVYASTDLTSWSLVSGVTLDSSGAASFSDSSVANVSYRFYKLTRTNSDCCSRAIGFTRVTVPGQSYRMIANQFFGTDDTLNGLFRPMVDGNYLPDGAQILKWNGSSFNYYTWSSGAGMWSPDGNAKLSPGGGAHIYNPNSDSITVAFAGLVGEGTLANSVQAGTYIYSALIPQSGGVTSVLGYAPSPGDRILKWTGTTYFSCIYVAFGGGKWIPSQPDIGVGESFFIDPATAKTWQVIYSPCP